MRDKDTCKTKALPESKVFIFFVIFLFLILTTSLIEKTLLVAIILIAAFFMLNISHRWFFMASFALMVNTGILLALSIPDTAGSTAVLAYYFMLTGIIIEIIGY